LAFQLSLGFEAEASALKLKVDLASTLEAEASAYV
jgi:hypothetical protein